MSLTTQAIFDNRQLALLIWIAAAIVLALAFKGSRPSVVGVAKALAAPKLLIILGALAAYSAVLIYVLRACHVWEPEFIGDTIFWFFGPAIVLLMRADKAGKDVHFFRKTLVSILTITAVVQFATGLYPMSLILEILLVPVLVLLGGLLAVAEGQSEYASARGLLRFVVAAVGLALLIYSVVHFARDATRSTTLSMLRRFVAFALLTIGLLPFIYLLAVFLAYGLMNLRLRWKLGEGKLYKYAKHRARQVALLRLRTINSMVAAYPNSLTDSSSHAEIDATAHAFKRGG